MVRVTMRESLGNFDPSSYLDVSHEYQRMLNSGRTQTFFSNDGIYDSSIYTERAGTTYFGYVTSVESGPSGRIGFYPDVVIEGRVNGVTVKSFLSGEVAAGRDAATIWRNMLAGDDVIVGNSASHDIHGYDGNDVLRAERGETGRLYGDDGNDLLFTEYQRAIWGGAGADTFVVTRPLDGAVVIQDFEHRIDRLALDANAFPEMGGRVTKANVVFGEAPTDADDRLIVTYYPEAHSAVIRYDPDGTGAAPAQLIMQIPTSERLTRADFTVVDASRFLSQGEAAPASVENHEVLLPTWADVVTTQHFQLV